MILLLVFVATTWLGRGLYDKLFMLEGQVFVVNATAEDHTIKLTFPLGEELKVDLKAGDSSRFMIGITSKSSYTCSWARFRLRFEGGMVMAD